MAIREATPLDRAWVADFLRERWGATQVAVHGEVIDAAALPALIADGGQGLATWRRVGTDAELMTLNAAPAGYETGTALIEALVALLRDQGCERLWLTTTNDNLSALRFYMRRGFRMMQVRPGANNDARMPKPSIPKVGAYGIPRHDEVEPCRVIRERREPDHR
jgi:GNAT superfamily N-acetyltransferase